MNFPFRCNDILDAADSDLRMNFRPSLIKESLMMRMMAIRRIMPKALCQARTNLKIRQRRL